MVHRLRRILAGWIPSYGPHYGLSAHLFVRGLGLLYLLWFWSLLPQVQGLMGPQGLMPVSRTIETLGSTDGAAGVWFLPSLLWFASGNLVLLALCVLGALAGVLLLFGWLPWWCNLAAWVCALSFVNLGQPWMGYPWDALLLEGGFVCMFMAAPGWRRVPAPVGMTDRVVGIVLGNLLLFKVMFGSGWAQLHSGDSAWLNASALQAYFETQPLPTVLAWAAQQLPGFLLRWGVWVLTFFELALSWYIFLSRTFRNIAAVCFAGLFLLMHLSGNYGILHPSLLLLSLTLVDDRTWRRFLPKRLGPPLPATETRPQGRGRGRAIALLCVAPLTVGPAFWSSASSLPLPWGTGARVLNGFHLSNSYRFFPRIPPRRYELDVQGSADGHTWLSYPFRYKPWNPYLPPRYAGFHVPRLDWQLCVAALSADQPHAWRREVWTAPLLRGLLRNDPFALSLFRRNPFHEHPPRYVRIVTHRMRFATPDMRDETGLWWRRQTLGLYAPPLSERPDEAN